MRKALFIFIGLFCSSVLHAHITTVHSRVSGAPSMTNIGIANASSFVVSDPQYSYMTANPGTYSSVFTNCGVINRVSLKYKESAGVYYTTGWSISVPVEITKWDATGTLITPNETTTLTITYDPASGTTYTDQSYYVLNAPGYKIKVTINGAPAGLSPIPADVTLEGEIETTRSYIFNQAGSPPAPTHQLDSPNKRLRFSWGFLVGAETYDLEWVHMSAYDIGSPAADFSRATRVTVNTQNYVINLPYDDGAIYYRVRGVGYPCNQAGYRQEGAWTATSSAISISDLDADRNWQYSVAYAEEGKRKEIVTFFDGTGKQRQAVTLNNTDGVALVGETMYDYEGRAAVQTLPSPTASYSGKLVYAPSFSLNALNSSQLYDKKIFDKDASYYNVATCTYTNPPGMHTSEGASRYYSNQNSFVNNGMYQALPDAQLYPFTQTVYGRDGRPVRQGAPGADHTIGSGHAVETFYATPTQQKLDRLFGNEVGYAEHYTQTAVKDANGQYSVSVMNLSGKTIYTAMAGASPASLDALASNAAAVSITEDFNNSNFLTNINGQPGYLINAWCLVTTTGTYTFTYTMSPEQYQSLCTSTNYNCAYDLDLNIFDECDQPLVSSPGSALTTTHLISGITPPSSYTITFTVNFSKIGLYRIEKILTLNQAALQSAIADFQADLPGTCFDSEATINGILDNLVDLTECDGCSAACVIAGQQAGLSGQNLIDFVDSCETHDCVDTTISISGVCDVMYNVFAGDMSPGGQYFDNINTTNSTVSNSWLQTYVWADGSANFASLGFCSGCTTWAQVRSNWQPGWETQTFASTVTVGSATFNKLAEFHPEFCHYTWCNNTATSQQFDANIYQNNNYTWATTYPSSGAPYLDITVAPIGTSLLGMDPYFITSPGSGADATAMAGQLANYLGTGQTMWAYAGTQAGCTSCDLQWQLFRAFYLGQKARLMHARQITQGCGFLCDANIPPDDIADACSPASSQGFLIRIPDVITNTTAASATTWGTNAQGLITCNESAVSDWFCVEQNGATCDIYWNGSIQGVCGQVIINGVDIACGLLCFPNPTYNPAQVAARIVNAINLCTSSPDDYLAEINPSSSTQFRIIAPVSMGASGNSLTVAITFSSAITSTISTGTFSGGVTGSSAACLPAKHCFCNEIDLLTTLYNTTSTSSPYSGSYIVDHATYTTAEAYIQYALNQAHGTSVTLTDVQAWAASCSTSVGADPALTLALITALDCSQEVTDCEEDAFQITGFYAGTFYQQLVDEAIDNFILAYTRKCLGNTLAEDYEVTHNDREYHYTLYYYDQSGNLTRTVPPAGVHLLSGAAITQANTYRIAGTGSAVYPDHSRATNNLVTNYNYNSLDQLKTQATPDGGTSTFWYDKTGRIITSQNAKQDAVGGTNVYSYTLYDGQNRPYQAGELRQNTAITQTIADDYTGSFVPWVAAATSRTEVIHTYYDATMDASIATLFSGGQNYLRQRVATVTHEYTDDGNNLTWNHATHYSYDVHGNVNNLVQDYPQLAHLGGNGYSQRYKKMHYVYDLISGKVNEVTYQRGEGDQYIHRYAYDADNRIISVMSSPNGIAWATDARYEYYLHGPLGRSEVGDLKVQGLDYAYTIQGWIKGVNSNVLDKTKDIGKDGYTGTMYNYITARPGIHGKVATDGYGYTLDYYWNTGTPQVDYKPINTAAQSLYNDAPGLTDGTDDLFNGNIKGMAVALMKPNTSSLPTGMPVQYNQYRYDQLNRIKTHQAYTGNSLTAYVAQSNSGEYRNTFMYDPNGNIITQNRNGNSTAGLSMDNLTYQYLNSTGGTYTITAAGPSPLNATSKLAHVDDAGTPGNYADDLEDQSSGNYTYDEIGQLTGDVIEEIQTIDWTLNNKIKSIGRTSSSTKKDLNFEYDAGGNRVLKITKERSGSGIKTQEFWTYTYYVRDAQGNVMATYERRFTTTGGSSAKDELQLDESHLYGSSRLGVEKREAENMLADKTYAWAGTYNGSQELILGSATGTTSMPAQNTSTPTRKLGKKLYELANHLGNVLVTVADRKLAVAIPTTTAVDYYLPDVVSTTDYSAFGASLPGRSGNSGDYRYGFNGKENDAETGTQDYGFRIYNPSLGKFLSVDPLTKSYPMLTPYQFASNKPINSIDLDGAESFEVIDFHADGRQFTTLLTPGESTTLDQEAYLHLWGETFKNIGGIPDKNAQYTYYRNYDEVNGLLSSSLAGQKQMAIIETDAAETGPAWYDVAARGGGAVDHTESLKPISSMDFMVQTSARVGPVEEQYEFKAHNQYEEYIDVSNSLKTNINCSFGVSPSTGAFKNTVTLPTPSFDAAVFLRINFYERTTCDYYQLKIPIGSNQFVRFNMTFENGDLSWQSFDYGLSLSSDASLTAKTEVIKKDMSSDKIIGPMPMSVNK